LASPIRPVVCLPFSQPYLSLPDLACGLDTLNAIQWTVDGKNKDAIVNSDGTVELADLGRWGGDQDSKLVCAVIPQCVLSGRGPL
jgi:hypothetical protein